MEKLSLSVLLPEHAEEFAKKGKSDNESSESIKNKVEQDLIRKYFEKIKNCDAVLIFNMEKKSIAGYVGGNTFLEMGFAHVLNKKVFFLNSIPEVSYKDEIIAMQPIILNGDFKKII
jgi:predicted RNA-binding protein with PUA domain